MVLLWNVMAHAQKPDFVFWRNGQVHLNWRGRQFSRPLAAEVCASAVVMLNEPCSEVVWRALATHPIRRFPLHFPSRASPCAITFQLDSNDISFNFYDLGNLSFWMSYVLCISQLCCSFMSSGMTHLGNVGKWPQLCDARGNIVLEHSNDTFSAARLCGL